MGKTQMTQGISQECHFLSLGLDFLSADWRGSGCSKMSVLPALPPHSSSSAQPCHPPGVTWYSRELHWAPKNPGLHRQRPGFTHTSFSRQASGPSQMAEKHPSRSEGLGLDQGTLSPLTGSQFPAPKELFPQVWGRGGCHWMNPSSRLRTGNQPPRRVGRSLSCVLPSLGVGVGLGYSPMVHS